ncbi:MAG: sel1 repeat family protein [Bacteroidales bacterium]|nr:sel1 repeat family protein [Bacteroidales bacterium]
MKKITLLALTVCACAFSVYSQPTFDGKIGYTYPSNKKTTGNITTTEKNNKMTLVVIPYEDCHVKYNNKVLGNALKNESTKISFTRGKYSITLENTKDGKMKQIPILVVPKDENHVKYLVWSADDNTQVINDEELLEILSDAKKNERADYQHEAMQKYLEAAKFNDPDAQYECAVRFFDGKGTVADDKKAIDWLKRAADKGYPIAIHTLGDCYKDGKGLLKDTKKAAELYRQAADSGFTASKYALALYYLDNNDINEALPLLKNSANAGYVPSKVKLGQLYLKGNDYSQARSMFEQVASDDTSGVADNELGLLYKTGKGGVLVNTRKAFDYFYSSANKGNDEGLFNIGECYYHGIGTNKDEESAILSYKKSADKNNVKAQNALGEYYASKSRNSDAVTMFEKAHNLNYLPATINLARCYQQGIGKVQNCNTAKDLYNNAAESLEQMGSGNLNQMQDMEKQKYVKVYYYIGLYFYEGCDKIEKDIDKAVKYFKQADDYGNIEATNILGNIFYYGEGNIIKSKDTAYMYWDKAARKGNTDAIYNMGVYHEQAKEVGIAIGYYRQVADSINISAAEKLGHFYYNGIGTERNYDSAYYYFFKASQKVIPIAQYYTAEILSNGLGNVNKNEELAFNLYEKAASHNCYEAMNRLGEIYKSGKLGQLKDKRKSLDFFKKAVAGGNADAQANLAEYYIYSDERLTKTSYILDLLNASLKSDNAHAQTIMGMLYYNNFLSPHINKDYDSAYAYLVKAAEQKQPLGEYYLGWFYYKHLGSVIKKIRKAESFEKAFQLFETAAAQGEPHAMYMLAICYINNEGIPKKESSNGRLVEIPKKDRMRIA